MILSKSRYAYARIDYPRFMDRFLKTRKKQIKKLLYDLDLPSRQFSGSIDSRVRQLIREVNPGDIQSRYSKSRLAFLQKRFEVHRKIVCSDVIPGAGSQEWTVWGYGWLSYRLETLFQHTKQYSFLSTAMKVNDGLFDRVYVGTDQEKRFVALILSKEYELVS